MKVRIEFKPQDCWIGVFWKRWQHPDDPSLLRKTDVWVCLLPMLPLHVETWRGSIPFEASEDVEGVGRAAPESEQVPGETETRLPTPSASPDGLATYHELEATTNRLAAEVERLKRSPDGCVSVRELEKLRDSMSPTYLSGIPRQILDSLIAKAGEPPEWFDLIPGERLEEIHRGGEDVKRLREAAKALLTAVDDLLNAGNPQDWRPVDVAANRLRRIISDHTKEDR